MTSTRSANASGLPTSDTLSRRTMVGALAVLTTVAAESCSAVKAAAEPSDIEMAYTEFLALDRAHDAACTKVDIAMDGYVAPERPKHLFMTPGRSEGVHDGERWRSFIDLGEANRKSLQAFIDGPLVRSIEEPVCEVQDWEIDHHRCNCRRAQQAVDAIDAWHAENVRRREALDLPALEAVEAAAERARTAKFEEIMAAESPSVRDIAFQAAVLARHHYDEWHAYRLLERLVEASGISSREAQS